MAFPICVGCRDVRQAPEGCPKRGPLSMTTGIHRLKFCASMIPCRPAHNLGGGWDPSQISQETLGNHENPWFSIDFRWKSMDFQWKSMKNHGISGFPNVSWEIWEVWNPPPKVMCRPNGVHAAGSTPVTLEKRSENCSENTLDAIQDAQVTPGPSI